MKTILGIVTGCLMLCISVTLAAAEFTTVDSGICNAVENHRAVGLGEVFPADVGKLFCFTRIVGPYHAERSQQVEHVWYYKDAERARISLPIRSSNWGTYSSKIIQPHEVGDWRVELLDGNGEVAAVFQFFVREATAAAE